MNFVISHRQTSQSDPNPVILLRNHSTSNCCASAPQHRDHTCAKHGGFFWSLAENKLALESRGGKTSHHIFGKLIN